jgi:hypothetical protein
LVLLITAKFYDR